jgi:hypothetical protein
VHGEPGSARLPFTGTAGGGSADRAGHPDLARPAAHPEPLVPGTARWRLSPAAALGYGPVARACLQHAHCSDVIVSPGGPRSGTRPAGQKTRIRPCHLAARVATRHTPPGCRARTPAMTRHGRRARRKRHCPAPGVMCAIRRIVAGRLPAAPSGSPDDDAAASTRQFLQCRIPVTSRRSSPPGGPPACAGGPQQALPDHQTPSTASSRPDLTAVTNSW